MIICGVDLETGGLSTDSAILEIGLALYCTKFNRTYELFSTWVYGSEYPPLNEEALKVNGLSKDAVQTHGIHPRPALETIARYFQRADAVMGHNILSFDGQFITSHAKKFGVSIPERPWIDSRVDLPFPAGMSSRRLQHLAIDHGLSWDHKLAHSALYDIQMMFEIAKNYDLELALERSKSPQITIETKLNISQNQMAKDRRYYWYAANKTWRKNIREIDFDKEQKEAPFDIKRV